MGLAQGCVGMDAEPMDAVSDEVAQAVGDADTNVTWACQNAGRWRVDVEVSGDIGFNRSAYVNVAGGGVFLASVTNNQTREVTHPDFHSSQYMWGSICVVHVDWPGYVFEFYPTSGSNTVGGSASVSGTSANARVAAYRQT